MSFQTFLSCCRCGYQSNSMVGMQSAPRGTFQLQNSFLHVQFSQPHWIIFFFYFSSPCLSPGSLPSYLLQNSRLATIKKEENWVHHWMWALALFPLPLDPVCVLLFTLSCNGGFRCFGCCCQALKAEWYKCEVKRILRSLTAIADKAGNSPAHTKQLLLWTGSRDVLWCILGLT